MRLIRRIAQLFGGSRFDKDLEEEMRLHQDLRAAKLRESGVAEPDAAASARRAFGNALLIREESRDLWGWRFLESFAQDVRYAVRQFRANPGFTMVAIVTLALGIGVNTAMFTIISGVLLRSLPYPEADRLVALAESRKDAVFVPFSYPNFLDVQREGKSFEQMAAWQMGAGSSNLTAPGEPEIVQTQSMGAGLLSVLRVEAAHGREFLAEEDRDGGAPVAMLNHSLWQERFAGNAEAVGKTLTLNGKVYTIVGILPEDFRFFPPATQVLLPVGQTSMMQRDVHPGLFGLARLKPGVTLEEASGELTVIGHQVAEEFPKTNDGVTFIAKTEKERQVGDGRTPLLALALAVGLVLLIACTNVANILLARSVSRAHEFAIRSSLGAGKARVVRQLLTESTLLGLLGGVGGLALAVATIRIARSYLPADTPRIGEITTDFRVLLFALAVSVGTGLLFGLLPALRQQHKEAEVMRQASRGSARGVRRMQGALVIAEVALTVVLMAGAGLMLRTLLRLSDVDPGFDPHNVFSMRVALSPTVSGDADAIRNAWRQILQDVEAVPGVVSASVTGSVPLSGEGEDYPYWTTPEPPPANKTTTAILYSVTPDYLLTMKIPLLKGRFVTEQDRADGEPVVVIDEMLAARAFPNEDAVGKQISFLLLGTRRVVGVVGHVKHWVLDEEVLGATMPEMYLPFDQVPWMNTATNRSVLVRTSGSPLEAVPAIRRSVLGPHKDQPIQSVQELEDMIGGSATVFYRRIALALLAIFAGLALALASIGIYGVISYSVHQRVQEMGIRMALGAPAEAVRWMVIRQGMTSVLVGVLVGVAAAVGVTDQIQIVFYGVAPHDPLTLAAVVVVLLGVACVAAMIPAWRASRVDPVVALRYQ